MASVWCGISRFARLRDITFRPHVILSPEQKRVPIEYGVCFSDYTPSIWWTWMATGSRSV